MPKNPIVSKILEHPDKEEILSKMCIGVSAKDIHDWLAAKYSPAEKKFVISAGNLSKFNKEYLDVYEIIHQDLLKTKANLKKGTPEEEIKLSISGLPAYKDLLVKSAGEELDIKSIIKNLCIAIETRLAQVFDQIQSDPNNIDTRLEKVIIDYANTLQGVLEKYHKFYEAPALAPTNMIINNNMTIEVVDKHIAVFHDVIREILSQMDLESSLVFMEIFNEKMSSLKSPDREMTSSETRLAEAKLLNETITARLN